jgi:hypothetical protein
MNTFATCTGTWTSVGSPLAQAVAKVFEAFAVQNQVANKVRANKQVAVTTHVALSERQQALTIRAAWMRQMGLSQQEIDQACSDPNESVDLKEEIRNLKAAERLPVITPPSSVLRKWATWV